MRARGRVHNWSPLALAPTAGLALRVLLVDTTRHLTRVRMARGHPAAVTAQTGVSMEALLGFLEAAGHGLIAHPAPGDLTLGGVLAIDGHGTAVPARGERVEAGESFGSVSNLVLSLTAVVWSERGQHYVLQQFDRDDPICASLLTHLGRAFVTSRVDIPACELFAAPPAGGPTLASFLDADGRVEAIMYPFTENPWLKVWSVSPRRPAGSRRVTAPYNYPFSDTLPDAVQRTLRRQFVSDPGQAVAFGQLSYQQTVDGLGREDAHFWGAAKNLLLYVRPSTLRATANGYAILTRRDDVQRVVSEFFSFYRRLLERYRARGVYPLNLPIEVRVTGLDHPGDVGIAGAQPALLSALSPAARSSALGRRRVARHPHVPRHPRRQPRLPGHRALSARELPSALRDRPPGVVEGLGLHAPRPLDRPPPHRRHVPNAFRPAAPRARPGTPPSAHSTASTRTACSRARCCGCC